jgi:hypothetical protein
MRQCKKTDQGAGQGIYSHRDNASASPSNSDFMKVKEELPVKHDLHI